MNSERAADYQKMLTADIFEMLSFARTSGIVIPEDLGALISDLFAESESPKSTNEAIKDKLMKLSETAATAEEIANEITNKAAGANVTAEVEDVATHAQALVHSAQKAFAGIKVTTVAAEPDEVSAQSRSSNKFEF